MTGNEYQRLALTTLNPALSGRDVLINGVMGLCGEAGEAIDLVKKHLAQGHELDREKPARPSTWSKSIWPRDTSWTAKSWRRSWVTWPGIWPRRPMPSDMTWIPSCR